MDEFDVIYQPLRDIPHDFDTLFKHNNKTELSNYVVSALKALKVASKTMNLQSDTIMKTTRELLHQCEVSRMSCSSDSNSYASSLSAMVKHPLQLF